MSERPSRLSSAQLGRPERSLGLVAPYYRCLGNREPKSEPTEQQEVTAAPSEVSAESSQYTAQLGAASCHSLHKVKGYSGLAAVVQTWPKLPPAARAAILAVVRALAEQANKNGRR